MSSNDEILKDLECPVCYELPSARIFQCRNGHIVCERCYDGMQEQHTGAGMRCTSCRIPLVGEKIRALWVEVVIEKLRTKCKNEPLGCEYRGDGGPDDRRSHESRCELNDQENAQDATRRPSRGEFVLLNVSNITMCLDVPWSRAREFEAVEIYQFVHRGENQLWKVQNGCIVSVLQPTLCLGARRVQNGEPIILARLGGENALTWRWGGNNQGIDQDGKVGGDHIVCAQNPRLWIGCDARARGGIGTGLLLQNRHRPGQHWRKAF